MCSTPVVFRIYRDGDVIALFPTYRDVRTGLCDSYMHIGQHSGADYDGVMRCTRPATPTEYAALADELTRIGYVLRPYSRRPRPPRVTGYATLF